MKKTAWLALFCLGACDGAEPKAPTDGVADNNAAANNVVCEDVLRPRSNPVEFVGLSLSTPTTADDFGAFLDPLYGDEARQGRFHRGLEVQPGVRLSAAEDPDHPEQVVIELTMEVASSAELRERTIFRAPASYAYGRIFKETALAALAHAHSVYDSDSADAEPMVLEHRLRSASGGSLDIRLRYAAGQSWMEIQTHAPHTSLLPGSVNTQAFAGDPYESLAGTVWFSLTVDQFEFFSKRAYGITAGAAQNFADFELSPHNWLRLTVTPQLEDDVVDVEFEVMTLGGERIALAKAPASLVAGQQFRENVFRMHRNMVQQEQAAPGASSRFEVPFYYDDPEGGGVVQVIAQGGAGSGFRIAYAVESPVGFLRDTGFVPYQGDVDTEDAPEDEATCEELGSKDAIEGRFLVSFAITDTIRDNPNLDGPLRGYITGAIYRAEDVGGLGPREGTQSVGVFTFDDVDLTDPDNPPTFQLDDVLPTGDYQLLAFMDIDGNRGEEDEPDRGDPVVLPIGAFPLRCEIQPVTVEFGVLLP